MPFENIKKYFRGSFQLVLSQFKKYGFPWKPEIKLSRHFFQSLKMRISKEEIHSISLKLNFTPNTLGCYGLMLL